MTAVRDAFRLARKHSATHMAASEKAKLRWGETSITEIVTAHAARAVTVVPFTQRAESLSGADWVWWWVDGASAYGMLVQAKRLDVTGSKWSFGFDYQAKTAIRPQREVLEATAAELNLLPIFALYLGTADSRNWAPCSAEHKKPRCLECRRRTVSLMPSLLAEKSHVTDASSTYARSVALEDVLEPSPTGSHLIPALTSTLAPDLKRFLSTRQFGTRAISRSMIDLVLQARSGMYALAASGMTNRHNGGHDSLGSVFSELPNDEMHGGAPYLRHLLSPLLEAPPSYVLEIAAGDLDVAALANEMPDHVAGIVVVPLQHPEG